MDWHSEVYKGSDFTADQLKQWTTLVNKVVKRDKSICQACRCKFSRGELTAHHIIPREEGGPDDLPNLITLCVPCHTFIELSEFRSWDEIIGCTKDLDLSGLVAREIQRDSLLVQKNQPVSFFNQHGRICFVCPTCERKFARERKFMESAPRRIIKCPCGSYTIYNSETDEFDWRLIKTREEYLAEQEQLAQAIILSEQRLKKIIEKNKLKEEHKKKSMSPIVPGWAMRGQIKKKYLYEFDYPYPKGKIHLWTSGHTLCDESITVRYYDPSIPNTRTLIWLNKPVKWCQECLKIYLEETNSTKGNQ